MSLFHLSYFAIRSNCVRFCRIGFLLSMIAIGLIGSVGRAGDVIKANNTPPPLNDPLSWSTSQIPRASMMSLSGTPP